MDEEVVSCVPSSKGAQRFPRSLYYVAVIVWVLAGSRSRLNDCDLFGFSRLVRSLGYEKLYWFSINGDMTCP